MGGGNWTEVINSYDIVNQATALSGAVTNDDGTVRPLTLYGLRHESRTVQRALVGGIVTRTDTVQVDGDFSAMPAGTTPPSPGNGPNPANASPPEMLSQWTTPSTTPEGAHTFVWSRLSDYTLVYSYVAGAPTPGVPAVPTHTEILWITTDSNAPDGPLDDITLIDNFHLVYDLTRSAQFF
jgi:hypothetical protein